MSHSRELPESPGGVLLCGASCRAAAWSARRAALEPCAVDIFQDADLRAVCAETRRSSCYPHDLQSLLGEFPPGLPWMYTGGLENHSQLVDRVTETRPLWGNAGRTLQRIRDPRHVGCVLLAAGLPALDVRAADDPPPPDAGWLRKPVRSVAGQSISHWTSSAAAAPPGTRPRQRVYYQRFCDGAPHAALFLAGWPEPGQVRLLGVTRQLMAGDLSDGPSSRDGSSADRVASEPDVAASQFTYAGSLGPVELPVATEAQLTAAATALTADCGLRGLCGIDFILDSRDTAWPVEINPRYPASAEVLELAFGRPLLRWHAACFTVAGSGELTEPGPFRREGQPRFHVGKVIVRTPATVRVDRQLATSLAGRGVSFVRPQGQREQAFSPDVLPRVFTADIPQSGTLLTAGAPCCTLLVGGVSLDACRKTLQAEAAALRELLRHCAAT